MIIGPGAALVGLLTSAAPGGDEIVLRHDTGPRYARMDYEAACGSTVFRVRFRNGPDERGRVDHVLIDGRPIAGAAVRLQLRAARRSIDRIEIMNCGSDEKRPEFRGVLALSEAQSRVAGMRALLFFRLTRQGRGRWQFSID